MQGLRRRMRAVDSRPATDAELRLTHSPELIAAVRDTPNKFGAPGGAQSKYFSDENAENFGDAYFNKHTSSLAELAAGGLIELLDHMAAGIVHNGIAVIRPPGHHAECHKSMGFCVYNNGAVAINAARAQHPNEFKKVLIVVRNLGE